MKDAAAEGGIPKITHPTAKAFFDALDAGSSSSKQSESLRRKSQSLGWRNRHSQDEFYPLTVSGISFSAKQFQRGEVEGTYGTGATVWPAALVLIKYMERHPLMIRGKNVIDLGSGTGVTSVASALLGASHVICTDGEESVIHLASDNIDHAAGEIQGSKAKTPSDPATINNCPINIQKYWWGDGSLKASSCDVVLVADCVLPKLYPIAPLVQAIDELLSKPGAIAILSYEHRYYPDYDPRVKFEELAEARGLEIKVLEEDQLDPVYCVDDIKVWHVTRK